MLHHVLKFENNQLVPMGALDRFSLGDRKLYDFPEVTGSIVINLQQVNNFDTSGLAWLLGVVSHYQSNQVAIQIINASQQLIALAEISNVLELLPLSD